MDYSRVRSPKCFLKNFAFKVILVLYGQVGQL